jgi:hypothetical protein
LLFSDAWFIMVKSLLILLQLLSYLTHHFMSSIASFFKNLLLVIKLLLRISIT